MAGGYVKVWRELLDKPIWQCSTPQQKTILITLLAMANWQENDWEWQGKKFKAKPGQVVTSLQKIAERCGEGVSIKQVRTALTRFEGYGFLANQSTNRNRLITIVNWDFYQGEPETRASKRAGKGQAEGKQRATIEEGKERKNNTYRKVQHLTLTEEEFSRLAEEYTAPAINEILDDMENWAGLKTKKSAYLTARNWLRRRVQDGRTDVLVRPPAPPEPGKIEIIYE